MITQDYSFFKTIDGNRKVNKGHVERLATAIERKNLLRYFPILLNEKHEVIDGQHRLLAAMKLDIPVTFEIVDGLELKDVMSINTHSKSWALSDFVDSHIELGKEHYKTLRDFAHEYRMGLTVAAALLMGNEAFRGGWRMSSAIKGGTFKVGSLSQAERIANQVRELTKYSTGFVPSRDREFISALLRLDKNKDFDFQRLISKLRLSTLKIEKRPSDKYYILQFEEIYNHNVKADSSRVELYTSTLKNTI